MSNGRAALANCAATTDTTGLQFHHVDAESKRFAISRNGTTRSWAELCAEADKCALLCANCHAEVEARIADLSSRDLPLRLRAA